MKSRMIILALLGVTILLYVKLPGGMHSIKETAEEGSSIEEAAKMYTNTDRTAKNGTKSVSFVELTRHNEKVSVLLKFRNPEEEKCSLRDTFAVRVYQNGYELISNFSPDTEDPLVQNNFRSISEQGIACSRTYRLTRFPNNDLVIKIWSRSGEEETLLKEIVATPSNEVVSITDYTEEKTF